MFYQNKVSEMSVVFTCDKNNRQNMINHFSSIFFFLPIKYDYKRDKKTAEKLKENVLTFWNCWTWTLVEFGLYIVNVYCLSIKD